MKTLGKIALLGFSIVVTPITFAQLTIPQKPAHVSEQQYQNGLYILENAYQQLKESGFNYNYADYWNFAIAYADMGQPQAQIFNYLNASKLADPKSFCSMVNYAVQYAKPDKKDSIAALLQHDDIELTNDCSSHLVEQTFDVEAYIDDHGYDRDLVLELDAIIKADQKYRIRSDYQQNADKQRQLDQQNLARVEKIIQQHGYPKPAQIGERFEHVIWTVIQHADLAIQLQYLPFIHKAVQQERLKPTPLKMLIDRIYTKQSGVQIWGSQLGFPIADEHTIAMVKKQYQLN